MKYLLATIIAIVCLPGIARADVRITEVAWMGTTGSQYSEWFELYNDSDTAVDLAGWKLYKGGSTLVFTLTKSISAGSYLLVERTTPSAPDAIPGINDESGSFSGGGFANTGEDLALKDDTGATVDSLDFASGWPAGDSTTKHTMQWDGGTWVTAAPTPKTATGGGGDDTVSTVNEKVDPEDLHPIPKVSPNQPHIEFITPTTIYRGVPYEYTAQPVYEYSYHLSKGTLYWNMGDGTVLSQTTVAPVTHTYQYAGTYTISFRFIDPTNMQVPLKGTKKITVVAPAVTIAIRDAKALEIKNTSSTPVDLSGWNVVAGSRTLTMPDMTIIAEKATATIPFAALGIAPTPHLGLIDPSGAVVAQTGGSAPKSAMAHTAFPETGDGGYGIEPADLVANTAEAPRPMMESHPIRNRTKTYIFGGVALFVIVLSILLERFMARQEY